MEKAGLYIHIPFCQKKCGYCDFYSITQLKYTDDFLTALLKEIKLIAQQHSNLQFDTIYMGGGTPTLLSSFQLENIIKKIQYHFSIDVGGEFSIEANPGTMSKEKLFELRNMGFNRLSMGAQAFHDADLQFLGRIHTVKDIITSYEAARKAGFNNINIDLLTAFPGQTYPRFLHTLEQTIALKPEHISCYTLILEQGTPFYRLMKKGELIPLKSDEEAFFFKMAYDFLSQNGYMPYEISNFATHQKFQCQHNLRYWNHLPYVGLGPFAHSFISPYRWQNSNSLNSYLNKLSQNMRPVDYKEQLTKNELEFEYIFLHLRTKSGLKLSEYQNRFQNKFDLKYIETLRKLLNSQLVEKTNGHIRLTSKGWLLADEIACAF
jgi:oxygen-independent coproporphyrinogen-3 oxidase